MDVTPLYCSSPYALYYSTRGKCKSLQPEQRTHLKQACVSQNWQLRPALTAGYAVDAWKPGRRTLSAGYVHISEV